MPVEVGAQEVLDVRVTGAGDHEADVEVTGGRAEHVQELIIGEVDPHGTASDTELAVKLVAEFLDQLLTTSDEHEVDSVRRQLAGKSSTDAGRGPGDDRPRSEPFLVDPAKLRAHEMPPCRSYRIRT